MKVKYKVSAKKTVDVEVSEEVAQIFTELDRFDANARRKDRWRKEVSIEAVIKNSNREPSDEVNIEDEYIKKEEKETLAAAVAQLTPKQQMLIRLHFYENVSFSEMAHRLGISRSAVTQQFSVIYRNLKNILKQP